MLNLCCDDKEKRAWSGKVKQCVFKGEIFVVMLFVLCCGWAELLYNLYTLSKKRVSFIWIQYFAIWRTIQILSQTLKCHKMTHKVPLYQYSTRLIYDDLTHNTELSPGPWPLSTQTRSPTFTVLITSHDPGSLDEDIEYMHKQEKFISQ